MMAGSDLPAVQHEPLAAEHRDFRESFRRFLDAEVAPRYGAWRTAGTIDPDVFSAAAALGFVAMQVPERFGGPGIEDFRFNAIVGEEAAAAGFTGLALALATHNDLGIPLLLAGADAMPDDDARMSPIAAGRSLTAVVLEPDGLRATTTGGGWTIDGEAHQIVGAPVAGTLIVMLPEDEVGHTLVTVAADAAGVVCSTSDPLIGMAGCPVGDVRFTAVEIPASAMLGARGRAAAVLGPEVLRHRLSVAACAVGLARAALTWTVGYVRERRAFGQPIASFENTQLMLGDAAARLDVAAAYLDGAIGDAVDGRLTARRAAAAKLACTSALHLVVDHGVQLHGGYGYMLEYPIAHAYADARFLELFAGTNEELRQTVAGALGL